MYGKVILKLWGLSAQCGLSISKTLGREACKKRRCYVNQLYFRKACSRFILCLLTREFLSVKSRESEILTSFSGIYSENTFENHIRAQVLKFEKNMHLNDAAVVNPLAL